MMVWIINVLDANKILLLFIHNVKDVIISIVCNYILIINFCRECDILIHSNLKVCPGCSWYNYI